MMKIGSRVKIKNPGQCYSSHTTKPVIQNIMHQKHYDNVDVSCYEIDATLLKGLEGTVIANDDRDGGRAVVVEIIEGNKTYLCVIAREGVVDLKQTSKVNKQNKSLTRKDIKRLVEDAVLIGYDYGANRCDLETVHKKKEELLKNLLG